MRAVLDTNVLISGLLWNGIPQLCILAADAGLYEMVSAEAILEEVREKLIQKFGNTKEFKGESNIPFTCDSSSLKCKDGIVRVPSGPGFGITIEPDFVRRAEKVVAV